MRVGGLATGMDIEEMVNKLMDAEKIPLERMQQDQTKLEWERDAFRDVNRALLKLDDLMLDMKLSSTYESKTVSSSQEDAITATAGTSSEEGTYSINVEQLATPAMNVGEKGINLEDEVGEAQTISINTYNDNGEINEIEVKEDDTVEDVLVKITNEDNDVRAFYDEQNERVILETTRTGQYNDNDDGPEIVFEDGEDKDFFTDTLGLTQGNETGGENAEFTYNNDLVLESQSNSYELNGIQFEFKNVTDGNAAISVTKDTDHAFDSIMKFVDQYNEVVESLNGSQQEEIHRDFPPLTDEQKSEMSEKEIENWEEKAQSGILRGESAISNGLFSMRQDWYSNVENDDGFSSLTEIGIETSPNYLDGGKLVVNEDELRQALQDDIEGVQNLFSDNSEGVSRGLVNRLEDSVKSTMDNIERRAGNSMQMEDNYTIGRRMNELDDRISAFEERMVRVETRYWNQFTQMEKAIQQMNDQSSQLFSQLGGEM